MEANAFDLCDSHASDTSVTQSPDNASQAPRSHYRLQKITAGCTAFLALLGMRNDNAMTPPTQQCDNAVIAD